MKPDVLSPKGLNWVQHWVSRIGLYLGVLIDANINFKEYMDKLLGKISKRIRPGKN